MKVAVYARVSTDEQTSDNQMPDLERFCAANNYTDVEYYRENGSAWREGHQPELKRLMDGLRSGRRKYDVLIAWSLDRLTRGGALPTLTLVHTFKQYGCRVLSVREPWLNVEGPFNDVLYTLVGWIADFESRRKSERVKAGLERARKNGTKLGRREGSKDKSPRRKSGYLNRWMKKSTVEKGKN